MRSVVAKRLRREARALTPGMLERSSLRKHDRRGRKCDGDQTTRAVYRRLKREYR
jgi:hypothetical protein